MKLAIMFGTLKESQECFVDVELKEVFEVYEQLKKNGYYNIELVEFQD